MKLLYYLITTIVLFTSCKSDEEKIKEANIQIEKFDHRKEKEKSTGIVWTPAFEHHQDTLRVIQRNIWNIYTLF